jgi:hypothetical protein
MHVISQTRKIPQKPSCLQGPSYLRGITVAKFYELELAGDGETDLAEINLKRDREIIIHNDY